MLSIVYSSHLGEVYNKKFNKHISETIGLKNNQYEILCYENYGNRSLTEVYNQGLKDSKYDYVLFCHNDITFDTKNWGFKVKKLLSEDDFGIIGVAGTDLLLENGKWWEKQTNMYGIVNHEQNNNKWSSQYSKKLKYTTDVVTVDGVLFFVDKDRLKANFNEDVKGFHFYDIDFCVNNFIQDVPIGVTTDILITHQSVGQVNEKWEYNRKQFVELYKDNLPLRLEDETHDIENYIFIHDQDILLKLEETKNYEQLGNYTYVFLGNRDIDKLKDIKNIIIARDLEYNLEEYKSLCSYSGWYLLWKNNLIKSEYVNLFEYDIELENHFKLLINKNLTTKYDVCGYIPLQTTNFHFIKNSSWVDKLFEFDEKLKNDLYKIVRYYNYWITTSNVTLSTSFFNKYMKWCEKYILGLKEWDNVGHALERLLSIYLFIHKKEFTMNVNTLKHLQLDSHKTQGHATKSIV